MFQPDARFLIIDDSKVARDIIRVALHQLQYENVDEVKNGKEGLEKIMASVESRSPYALVVCDIEMPELGGLQLLEEVRKDERTSQLPFVMITTEAGRDAVMKAVMSGISGYLVKPVGVDDVKKKVADVYKLIHTSK